MKTYVIQIVCALLGSFGFSLLFNRKKDKIFLASLGGGLTWILYLLLFSNGQNSFTSYFWASVFATLYAEIMARILKAPVTIFVIPAVVPLIPGGSLYYAMECLMQKNIGMAREKAAQTAMIALAIAFGITGVIIVLDIISLFVRRQKTNE